MQKKIRQIGLGRPLVTPGTDQPEISKLLAEQGAEDESFAPVAVDNVGFEIFYSAAQLVIQAGEGERVFAVEREKFRIETEFPGFIPIGGVGQGKYPGFMPGVI